MRRHIFSFVIAGLMVAATAPALLAQTAGLAGSDAEMAAINEQVPGFGGLFYDKEGIPNVYLKDAGQAAYFQNLGSEVRVLPAQYDFRQLAGYRDALLPLLARPEVVLLDVDEARNRVTIGVDKEQGLAAAADLSAALASLPVPKEAIHLEPMAPIHNLATVRDLVRPVPGGVQINFGNFLCTLGFGATRAGVVGYVTNSHCTNVQGGVESTVHYQNLSPNRIGVEIADPTYFTGGACPAGRRCRYSDTSFGRYDSTATREFARIARPTAPGSLTISTTGPRFVITGTVANPTTGITLNKVGRTTGWSRGTVAFTCANVNVSGSTITQLCQSGVNAAVGGGDSGSPVFSAGTTTTSATLYGILWGGNSAGTQFVFSPWSGITRSTELGALTVF
ncbi:MAG TPA: hypothetical protein PK413_09005 [Thermoanaerobaculia bacterium]|nr:hypothetical protein [Thermoanaerobaculia bacterium]